MICAIENPQDFPSLQISFLKIEILIEVGGKHELYTALLAFRHFISESTFLVFLLSGFNSNDFS